jgi:hypothetical protein
MLCFAAHDLPAAGMDQRKDQPHDEQQQAAEDDDDATLKGAQCHD